MHLWGIPGIFKQLEELASFPSWKEEMLGMWSLHYQGGDTHRGKVERPYNGQ